MNPFGKSSIHIRRRMRRSAEVLVDDVGLRSNLTDAQAERLLDWGLGHVRNTARQTARLSDEDAYPLLKDKAATVRRVMRVVNRLMESPTESAAAALDYHVARLLISLAGLAGRKPGPALQAQGEMFTRIRPHLDDERAFRLLMELIDRKLDDTGEEE